MAIEKILWYDIKKGGKNMEEILRAIIHLTNEMKEIKDGMGRMENEVQDLRNEMKEIKDEMKEIKDGMGRMKEEIQDLRSEMKEEIQDLRNEMARGFKSAMEERLEFFGIGSKFYIRINERVEELEKKIG
ncbi:MAG: hypothetical protein Q4A75_08010 [Peptostreptococcaceae bacterium]|nr:hypothetical protein [Peptostreptococcaceae bacterium]